VGGAVGERRGGGRKSQPPEPSKASRQVGKRKRIGGWEGLVGRQNTVPLSSKRGARWWAASRRACERGKEERAIERGEKEFARLTKEKPRFDTQGGKKHSGVGVKGGKKAGWEAGSGARSVGEFFPRNEKETGGGKKNNNKKKNKEERRRRGELSGGGFIGRKAQIKKRERAKRTKKKRDI